MDASDVHVEIPISFKGDSYLITRPNFETEGRYCAYLKGRARDAAGEFAGSPAHADALQAYTRDVAAGVYLWGSTLVWTSLRMKQNLKELAFLVFAQSNKGLVRDGGKRFRFTLDEMAEDQAVWDQVELALSEVILKNPKTPSQEEAGETPEAASGSPTSKSPPSS